MNVSLYVTAQSMREKCLDLNVYEKCYISELNEI